MSKRNQTLLGILLLVVLWFGLNIGLLFFIDLLYSDHWRSWFSESAESYKVGRIIKPFISGVFILYLWVKIGIERTGILWLCFAFVVLATLIYTLAVPAPKHLIQSLSGDTKEIPTIICDKDDPTKCREFKLP